MVELRYALDLNGRCEKISEEGILNLRRGMKSLVSLKRMRIIFEE